jgi:hypothetical protein
MIMGMPRGWPSPAPLLGILPSQTGTQIATFGGMVLFGAIVQWRYGSGTLIEGDETRVMPTQKEDVIHGAASFWLLADEQIQATSYDARTDRMAFTFIASTTPLRPMTLSDRVTPTGA